MQLNYSVLVWDAGKPYGFQTWLEDREYTVCSNVVIICDCVNWWFRASFVSYPYVYIAPKWSLFANSVTYTVWSEGLERLLILSKLTLKTITIVHDARGIAECQICTSYYTLLMVYCLYCMRPEGEKYAIRHWGHVVSGLSQNLNLNWNASLQLLFCSAPSIRLALAYVTLQQQEELATNN